MERLKLIRCNVVLTGIIVGGVYWVGATGEKEKAARIEGVNKNDKYARGIITSYFSSKGRSVGVKYTINKKDYEYSGGWDINPNNIQKGDSIWFRYSVEDPSLIITELEKAY
jgi:hypothetical protein